MQTKALALAVLLLLGGCATGPDRVIRDHPPTTTDRPNGQPGWIPCMVGDMLCQPQR